MAEEEKKQKNKKVNKMQLSEVEAALKKTEEHMGGLESKYAHALLAQKEKLKG